MLESAWNAQAISWAAIPVLSHPTCIRHAFPRQETSAIRFRICVGNVLEKSGKTSRVRFGGEYITL